MDALAEVRIRQLEQENRALHEQIDALNTEGRDHQAEISGLKEQIGKEYQEQVGVLQEHVAKIEKENNALRTIHAEALAFGREKQNQYDALCTTLAELGEKESHRLIRKAQTS